MFHWKATAFCSTLLLSILLAGADSSFHGVFPARSFAANFSVCEEEKCRFLKVIFFNPFRAAIVPSWWRFGPSINNSYQVNLLVDTRDEFILSSVSNFCSGLRESAPWTVFNFTVPIRNHSLSKSCFLSPDKSFQAWLTPTNANGTLCVESDVTAFLDDKGRPVRIAITPKFHRKRVEFVLLNYSDEVREPIADYFASCTLKNERCAASIPLIAPIDVFFVFRRTESPLLGNENGANAAGSLLALCVVFAEDNWDTLLASRAENVIVDTRWSNYGRCYGQRGCWISGNSAWLGVGQQDFFSAFRSCNFSKTCDYHNISSKTLWYSFPKESQCSPDAIVGSGCSWSEAKVVRKIVALSCIKRFLPSDFQLRCQKETRKCGTPMSFLTESVLFSMTQVCFPPNKLLFKSNTF